MKLFVLMGLVAVVLLLSGCTDISLGEKDCGADVYCLNNAIKTCEKVRFEKAEFGLVANFVVNISVLGKEGSYCKIHYTAKGIPSEKTYNEKTCFVSTGWSYNGMTSLAGCGTELPKEYGPDCGADWNCFKEKFKLCDKGMIKLASGYVLESSTGQKRYYANPTSIAEIQGPTVNGLQCVVKFTDMNIMARYGTESQRNETTFAEKIVCYMSTGATLLGDCDIV